MARHVGAWKTGGRVVDGVGGGTAGHGELHAVAVPREQRRRIAYFHRSDRARAGVARRDRAGKCVAAGRNTLKYAGPVARYRDRPGFRNLQGAPALVAVVGDSGGALGKRLRPIAVAAEQVAAGCVAGVGVSDQLVELPGDGLGHRLAVRIGEGPVSCGDDGSPNARQQSSHIAQYRLGLAKRIERGLLVGLVLSGKVGGLAQPQRLGGPDRVVRRRYDSASAGDLRLRLHHVRLIADERAGIEDVAGADTHGNAFRT